MLLNITYNFGNHRTVTKRLNFTGHAEYILSLSAEELKTVDLLYYHEPNKDELFALQNLKAIVLDASRRKCNEKASNLKHENKSSRPVQVLFLDETQMNARYSQEDSGGGECMCDWEYRTRCTCGFEAHMNTNPNTNNEDVCGGVCDDCGSYMIDCECPNLDSYECGVCGGAEDCICDNDGSYLNCGGCGENEQLCDCATLFPRPKPHEVNTNLLRNADYFQKRAREKTLTELNNFFSDLIEKGETAMLATFEPWLIDVLREKGYDIELVSIDQLEDKERENDVTVYGYVAATVFLAGRN